MTVDPAPSHPWLPGAATGVGSLPLTDPSEAARLVLGELPDLPHLPELPGRGAGADLLGRTATLLVDLHVDLQPSGWRLVDRAGADERRAVSLLRQDLDALEEQAQDYRGPLKLQVAGPLTLAAGLERTRGGRVVGDHGARRDLAQSLAEGAAAHVAELRRRLPATEVLLQLDEPSLPAVLGGGIPTASGFGRLRSVGEPEAVEALRLVGAASAYPIVHCCAVDVPVALLARAGARAVSFDAGLVRERELDAFAEAAEAGVALWPGVVATDRPDGPPRRAGEIAEQVRRRWHALGLDEERAVRSTVVTPTCGLAGADPAWAREALALVRAVGRELTGAATAS